MNLQLAPARGTREARRRRPAPPRPGAGLRGGALTWLLAAVALVMAVNVMITRSLAPDSFYDLYAGRWIAHHGIPHTNVFTSVAGGAAWADQQWLAQLIFYRAWVAAGYPALAALSSALVAAGFAVLALTMLRRGVPATRAFAWTCAAYLACITNTVIRAQSFGYLLFPVTLWLLMEDRRAPRPRPRTWLVIAVLVVWANTHGSVLLGAGMATAYGAYRAAAALAARRPRPAGAYLGLAAASAASVACTPYGAQIIGYYRTMAADPLLGRYIVEWAAPALTDPGNWGFFMLVGVVAIASAAAWRRGARPDPLLGGLAAVLLVLGLTGVRFELWFAFAGALLAADALARASRGRELTLSAKFTTAMAGTLGLLALSALAQLAVTPAGTFENQVSPRALAAAAAAAASHPGTRVLCDMQASTAMLWLHPAMAGRIGFDIRMEQYTSAELRPYLDFLVRGPGWQRITSGYGIIAVSRYSRPLASALARLPGWRVVYADPAGLVLTRQ